jgi:hypothetical protein
MTIATSPPRLAASSRMPQIRTPPLGHPPGKLTLSHHRNGNSSPVSRLNTLARSSAVSLTNKSPLLRCSLPSEALEEFLSILRQSSSPSRHRRTSGANTVPAIFPYHHSFKYGRIELVPQRADLAGVEEIERSRSAQLTPPRSPATEDGREFGDLMTRDFDSLTARWFTPSNLCEHADLI